MCSELPSHIGTTVVPLQLGDNFNYFSQVIRAFHDGLVSRLSFLYMPGHLIVLRWPGCQLSFSLNFIIPSLSLSLPLSLCLSPSLSPLPLISVSFCLSVFLSLSQSLSLIIYFLDAVFLRSDSRLGTRSGSGSSPPGFRSLA